ncbi:MAG: EthD domain-containing protein, partial [Alphaproteobacteria bacterium]
YARLIKLNSLKLLSENGKKHDMCMEANDIIKLEAIVEEFRERYRSPIMPVHDYLQIERELCEVLLRFRSERWWDMSEQELREYRGARTVKKEGQFAHSLMVLYPPPKDVKDFNRQYMEEHVPMAQKLGAKLVRVSRVTTTIPRAALRPVLKFALRGAIVPGKVISFLLPHVNLLRSATGEKAPYHLITELHFDDLAALQAAAGTDDAKAAVEHGTRISTGGAPILMILESDMALDEVPGEARPPWKLLIAFPRQPDEEAFEKVWIQEIVPAAMQVPCECLKAYKVVGTADGSPAPFHRIAELYYNSHDDFLKIAATQKVRDVVAHILGLSPAPLVMMTTNQV